MCVLIRSFWLVALALITMSEAVDKMEALLSVWASVDQFSSPFFQTMVEYNPGNFITSPLSASIALAMAACGARGNTEVQFRNVLHLPTSEDVVTSGYQSLIDNLNNVKNIKLAVANKLFIKVGLDLKPSYKNLTEVYFGSSPQLVYFAQSRKTANIINSWVEQNINNRSTEVITADILSDETKLVLVNTIYFKGQWRDKFDSNLTKHMPFRTSKVGVKTVPIMYRRGKYKHGDVPGLNARFVVIPYKGDELSMVIIHPNKINGVSYVQRKLQNIDLRNILNHGEEQTIQLWLPKFKVESMLELTDVLLEMGLIDAFTSEADFSGIADGDLLLNDVIQKAYIEVNEKGSEEGVDTGDVTYYTLPNEHTQVQFRINKPFHYYIIKTMKDEVGNDIHLQLFSGSVNEPIV